MHREAGPVFECPYSNIICDICVCMNGRERQIVKEKTVISLLLLSAISKMFLIFSVVSALVHLHGKKHA